MNITFSTVSNHNSIRNNAVNNRAYYPVFTAGQEQDTFERPKKSNWLERFARVFSPKKPEPQEIKKEYFAGSIIQSDEREHQEIYNKTCDALRKRLYEKHGIKLDNNSISEHEEDNPDIRTEAIFEYEGQKYNADVGFNDKYILLSELSSHLDGILPMEDIVSLRRVPNDSLWDGFDKPKNELEEKWMATEDKNDKHLINRKIKTEVYEREEKYLKDKYGVEIIDCEEDSLPDELRFKYGNQEYYADMRGYSYDIAETTYRFARFLDGFDNMEDPILIYKKGGIFIYEELTPEDLSNDLERRVADVKSGKVLDEYLDEE